MPRLLGAKFKAEGQQQAPYERRSTQASQSFMKVDTFVRTFDFCTSAVKILPIDLGPRAAV